MRSIGKSLDFLFLICMFPFLPALTSPSRIIKLSFGRHLHSASNGPRKQKGANEQWSLRAYYITLQEGLFPDVGILIAALKACGTLRDVRTGRKLHLEAAEMHGRFHIFVENTLIDMYAKCRSMLLAVDVFETMDRRDVISWNCLIMGYAYNGDGKAALEVYSRMQHGNECIPDAVTHVAGLKACISLTGSDDVEKLDRGRGIHLQASKLGYDLNIFLASSLIDFYTKCGSLLDAREVFERMPRNVVAWTTIIHGYVHAGKSEMALELYSRMQKEGCLPNEWTYVAALRACASLADTQDGKLPTGKQHKMHCLEKGKAIHAQAGCGAELDLLLASSLVDMYVKCGSVADARKVFDRMKHRDVVSWTAMILGYAEENGDVALQLYSKMRITGCLPNAVTFVAATKACATLADKEEPKVVDGKFVKVGALEKGKTIHFQAVVELGRPMQTFVCNTLVDMYSKCGSLVDAFQVFHSIAQKDVVSWNCIITGCVQCKEAAQAMELYTNMVLDEQSCCKPNASTFIAALKACGSAGALESGRRVEEDLCEAGMQNDLSVANTLVDFYGKCGSMADAERVFASIGESTRNLVSWTSLMAGYSRVGDAERVFDIFESMKKQRIRPDGITFVKLLNACSHAGLVDKGREYFDAMAEFDIVPDIGHYNCMIDLFGRANRLQEAVIMVENMPFAPVSVTWMSLLAASCKWKNVTVANVAFEGVVTLGGDTSAAYAMMSKVYT